MLYTYIKGTKKSRFTYYLCVLILLFTTRYTSLHFLPSFWKISFSFLDLLCFREIRCNSRNFLQIIDKFDKSSQIFITICIIIVYIVGVRKFKKHVEIMAIKCGLLFKILFSVSRTQQNGGCTKPLADAKFLPLTTWNKKHSSKQVVSITYALVKDVFAAATFKGF